MARNMSEKFGDFVFSHFARMPFLVKKDEPPNPIHVCLLGTQTVSPPPHESAQLIEQFRLVAGSGLGCNRLPI
jgi:hypothetical protein